MRLRILFLFLSLVTVILIIAQLTGSKVTDLIIIMATLDFLALGASIELQRKTHISNNGSSSIENIEKMCKDIYSAISNPGIEKIQKQGEDISSILDRITKKSLELEESLNKFGNTLNTTSKENPEQKFSVGELVYVEDEER